MQQKKHEVQHASTEGELAAAGSHALSQAEVAQAASELKAFKALETRGSRKRRVTRVKLIVIIASALILVVGGFFLLRNLLMPPAEVATSSTEPVVRGTFSEVIDSAGSLAAREQVTITSEIDGTVAEVRVNEGDSVTAGQVLFTIDNPELDQQIAVAQRGVDGAYISYNGSIADRDNANAQRDAAYQAYLDAQTAANAAPTPSAPGAEDTTLVSPEQAWEAYLAAQAQASGAQTQVNQVELQVKDAEATLAQAKEAASKRTIVSPIAGQVVVSNIERGARLSTLASGGKPPIQIADMSSMLVSVPINEIDILKLEVDQTAEVTFDAIAGYSATATVRTVATSPSGSGDSSTGGGGGGGVVSYQATLLIEDPDPRLKIGMSANATIRIKTFTDVLLVSALALQEDGTEKSVTILEEDGSTRTVPVAVLARNERQIVVEGALKEGDELVLGSGAPSDASTTTAADAMAILG
ncbi:MAG: efflux RND transporter periplasmic adaptor subunit [Coriobacteriales bacterium]|jgi:HlyD family secretion protein|nr:efflux RND transporter periplasmic adaptor subunit [Coriobacteriales bacterium]